MIAYIFKSVFVHRYRFAPRNDCFTVEHCFLATLFRNFAASVSRSSGSGCPCIRRCSSTTLT